MPDFEIKIEDYSADVLRELEGRIAVALESCGQLGEGYAKRLAPADTGILRNSIAHKVKRGENTVYIGTNTAYAPYVELGTGIYYPGGRHTPWVYQDEEGKWHMTRGSKAQPFIKPAVSDHVEDYKRFIESALQGE